VNSMPSMVLGSLTFYMGALATTFIRRLLVREAEPRDGKSRVPFRM
jgi:hypothetical protein